MAAQQFVFPDVLSLGVVDVDVSVKVDNNVLCYFGRIFFGHNDSFWITPL